MLYTDIPIEPQLPVEQPPPEAESTLNESQVPVGTSTPLRTSLNVPSTPTSTMSSQSQPEVAEKKTKKKKLKTADDAPRPPAISPIPLATPAPGELPPAMTSFVYADDVRAAEEEEVKPKKKRSKSRDAALDDRRRFRRTS